MGLRLRALRPDELGKMLSAIEVPSLHHDPNDSLDFAGVIRIAHALKQCRTIIDDRCTPPNFQTPAAFVTDQKQKNAIVFRKITDRDVLHIAGVIGEGKRAIIEYL